MIRTLHVNNDRTLSSGVARFQGPVFDNFTVATTRGRSPAQDAIGKSALAVPDSRRTVRTIVEMAPRYDLVVLHDLDMLKSMVANRVAPGVAVGWRFFGYELYRPPELYCSTLTLQALRGGGMDTRLDVVRRAAGRARAFLKWRRSHEAEFSRALGRVDYMFGMMPEEYEHLRARWGRLPKFVRFPLNGSVVRNRPDVSTKRDMVLVGNSRSIYNNHLDVLRTIETDGGRLQARFVVPFSYGPENAYSAEVQRRAAAIDGVETLDALLPRQDYRAFFERARAAIYNSYRQHALWNISVCLVEGVKVYLSEQSPTHSWLRRCGFRVFGMEELAGDLRTGALELSQDEADLNYELYRSMVREYTYTDFQQALRAELAAR